MGEEDDSATGDATLTEGDENIDPEVIESAIVASMDSHRRGNGRQHSSGNQRTRSNNMQTQRVFVPASNSFMPPQMPVPALPFANNFMYPDLASPMFLNGQGQTPSPWLVKPMHSQVYFPVQDPDLHDKILKQIEYYFSDDNLVKDVHLRQKMDDQGWVPVSIIASFNRVSGLTGDVRLILDVMRTSKAVEVQGQKMRKRNGWTRFQPIPKSFNVESLFSRSNCNKGVAMVSRR